MDWALQYPYRTHRMSLDMRDVRKLLDAVAGSPNRSIHVFSDEAGTFRGVRCLRALTKMGSPYISRLV